MKEPVQERILVRGVNWLGDSVMTLPALRRLREALPKAHISLLIRENLAPLFREHSDLDSVLTFRRNESPLAVARRLRVERFSTALIFPNSPRSAMEAWLARIPRRIGFATPWRRWLLTEKVAAPQASSGMRKRRVTEIKRLTGPGAGAGSVPAHGDQTHQMHHYLRLAATLGAVVAPVAPHLEVGAAELEAARQKLLALEGGRLPAVLLGMNPGAEYGPAKRWPAERFAAVARFVQQRVPDSRWILFGGPNERGLGEQISRASEIRMLNVAGETSLRELMALLKLCQGVLTNDTGPMHLAAAMGTSVVAFFGSTSKELTGPGVSGDNHHQLISAEVPCAPCFRRVCPIDFRCMNSIAVERVAEAVLGLISSAPVAAGRGH